jgi:hypothetical protein
MRQRIMRRMMSKKHNHKAWVAPIIAVVFIFTALTGVMKAFEIEIPGTKEVHSLLGLLLVLAGLTHLILNWKVLVYYLKQHRIALIGLFAGILLVSALIAIGVHASLSSEFDEGRDGGRDGRTNNSSLQSNG